MFQTLPIISRGHDKMLQPGAPSVFMVSRRSPLGLMGPQRGGGGSPLLGEPMSLIGDWSIPSSPGTFVLYKKNNHVLFLCPLTFSGELKSEDGVALFERSRLSIGCLNVNGNAVKDRFTKRKIHPLRGIKLMIGIAGIHGT